MSKKPASKSAAKVTELPDSATGEHGLTARQEKILQVIKASMQDQGCPPSMRAIAAAAGLSSPASVKYQLEILQEKGFITPHPTRGGVWRLTTIVWTALFPADISPPSSNVFKAWKQNMVWAA